MSFQHFLEGKVYSEKTQIILFQSLFFMERDTFLYLNENPPKYFL